MKLVNTNQIKDHENRIKTVKEQHKEQLAQVENMRPQPIDFEQHTGKEPLEIGDGVIAMPNHYYNKEMKIVVSPDDKAWKKA